MSDWELQHGRIGASELETAKENDGVYPWMWWLFFLAGLFIFCVLVSPKFRAEGVLEEVCAIAFNCMAPFALFLAACIGLGVIFLNTAFYLWLRGSTSNQLDIVIIMLMVVISEIWLGYKLFTG